MQTIVTWISDWAVASQQQARRNAMIASTALAQRRAERLDVEEYLAALQQSASTRAEPVPAPAAHG